MAVVEPSHRAFVILANAGIHSLLLVSLDSRIRGNDGQWQPSPGAPCLSKGSRPFVVLANAGIHSLQLVSLDSRIRGNDGQWQPPTVAYASSSEWQL